MVIAAPNVASVTDATARGGSDRCVAELLEVKDRNEGDHTMSTTTTHTHDATTELAVLRSKAADLRESAAALEGPLALTYRRRAAEIELQASALAARYGFDEPLLAA